MDRTCLLVWITPPKGMGPDQLCREVRGSISFGAPEVSLRPDCTCGEPGHGQCDDPRHHFTCGCTPPRQRLCEQCAPGYGHNNPTYGGPPDLHDGPWVNW